MNTNTVQTAGVIWLRYDDFIWAGPNLNLNSFLKPQFSFFLNHKIFGSEPLGRNPFDRSAPFNSLVDQITR
jgi:hypothetical protein